MNLLLELDLWDKASSDDRLAAALAAAETLPPAFSFDGLSTHSLGGQAHEVGLFQFDGANFALVPGSSSALLGYDRSHPFHPTEAQREDWQFTEEEYGYSIADYLGHYLTPLRRVPIGPLLFELAARSFEYQQDGRNQTEGYAKVQSQCGDGFRLPTTDEWEYVCAAGTRSIFRWGDDCPISSSYHEREWELHKRPNAFGVCMNSSTYDCEICIGPKFRGGDGGCSVCGGMGNVASWFPFASSYEVPDDEMDGWYIDEVLVRRVRSIATPNHA
jgi:hypothetical protein